MLVNKTSHKFTGKLGQKVDKTKCGHNYKIILQQIVYSNHSNINCPSNLWSTFISGYPYQGPKSGLGKLLSIGIACIGLPIFLLYVCLMGRFLGRNLQSLYNKLMCCSRRQISRTLEDERPKGEKGRYLRKVPGWLCLMIILSYLALGTVIMTQVHDVSMIDGLLYTFSLLVTIGVTLNSDTDIVCVLMTSVYILIGVAIMSMCAYCLSQVSN